MRALTLHQPWASLIALGVKTIETRSWSTSFRGRLAIHAGMRKPTEGQTVGDWTVTFRPTVTLDNAGEPFSIPGRWIMARLDDDSPPVPLPLGAVVATANLVDCVPIIAWDAPNTMDAHVRMRGDVLWLVEPAIVEQHTPWACEVLQGGTPITDQLPYGDFTPGRFAWLLSDVKATTDRCPTCWGSGRGVGPDRKVESPVAPGLLIWTPPGCPRCDRSGGCPPIPMRGHQGVWTLPEDVTR